MMQINKRLLDETIMTKAYDNWMIEVNEVIKYICQSSHISYEESNSIVTSILALGGNIEDIKNIFNKQCIYGLVKYIECLELDGNRRLV